MWSTGRGFNRGAPPLIVPGLGQRLVHGAADEYADPDGLGAGPEVGLGAGPEVGLGAGPEVGLGAGPEVVLGAGAEHEADHEAGHEVPVGHGRRIEFGDSVALLPNLNQAINTHHHAVLHQDINFIVRSIVQGLADDSIQTHQIMPLVHSLTAYVESMENHLHRLRATEFTRTSQRHIESCMVKLIALLERVLQKSGIGADRAEDDGDAGSGSDPSDWDEL